VKPKIWALPLACLALSALSVGSALAQQDATAPRPPMLHSSPDQSATVKALTPDASAAATSQLKTRSNASPDATDTCSYTFTSGSGYSYLQFCVTVNGNIAEFQSPVNAEQLTPGGSPAYEGYGICDMTISPKTAYWDYAGNGDSGNWNPPTKLSQTATSVKIERITSDGAWTLIQTFTSVPGTNPYAKITMELKNNSSVTKEVLLLRYANAVPYTAPPYTENYGGTFGSAWGWDGWGLMLQDVGILPVPNSLGGSLTAFAINTLDGPAPCNSAANSAGTIVNGVGSLVNQNTVTGLKKDQAFTVNKKYMQF
jgi:hypothetical protein